MFTKLLWKSIKDNLPLLLELEWSETIRGQGSGPMGSGGDGPKFACCPMCRQLEKPNGHFNIRAVGHKEDCKMAKALRKLGHTDIKMRQNT